jgi:hypothetical protein
LYQVQILDLQNSPPSLEYLQALGVKIVEIRPSIADIKQGIYLYNSGNEDLIDMNKSFVIVLIDKTWYTIPLNKSVVFVDKKTVMFLHTLTYARRFTPRSTGFGHVCSGFHPL